MNTTNLAFSDLGSSGVARAASRAALIGVSGLFLVASTGTAQPSMRPDSRLIYVSVNGNDANDGLSPATPKKTLAGAAAAVRSGYPDWIFLRRGDTWTEGFAPFDFEGRSADEPIVITAFGPGDADPKIRPADPTQGLPDDLYVTSYGVDYPELPDDDDDDGPGGASPPLLLPGDGWAGPTSQPPAVGDPSDLGYDARAIARWDVVPYQTFEGEFEVGVVAFHVNGIDRVEFSVDGGTWESVSEMTVNPRTGVAEYWARLDASEFDQNEPVEVRAIAWPTVGEPRVLAGAVEYFGDSPNWYQPDVDGDGRPTNSLWTGEHSLVLHATPDPSLLTPQVLELEAGRYVWGHPPLADPLSAAVQGQGVTQVDRDRWVVIRAADGVSPADIVIYDAETDRPYWDENEHAWAVDYDMVKLEGLTIEAANNSDDNSGLPTHLAKSALWLDDCIVRGPGQQISAGGFRIGHGFFTSTAFEDLRSGTGHDGSYNSGNFVRNCSFERFGEKCVRAGYFIANTTFDDLNPGSTGWHASAVSNPLVHDNRVYTDLSFRGIRDRAFAFRSESWNLYGHRDVAINGATVEGDPSPGYLIMLGGVCENVLFQDVEWTAPALESIWAYRITIPETDARYFQGELVVFDGVTWNGSPDDLPEPNPMPGVIVRP